MNLEGQFIKQLMSNFPECDKIIYHLIEKSVVDHRGMKIYLVKEAIRIQTEKNQKCLSKMGIYNNVAELLGMSIDQVHYYSRL